MMEVKTTRLAMSVPNSQPLVLLQISCKLSYLAGFSGKPVGGVNRTVGKCHVQARPKTFKRTSSLI